MHFVDEQKEMLVTRLWSVFLPFCLQYFTNLPGSHFSILLICQDKSYDATPVSSFLCALRKLIEIVFDCLLHTHWVSL